MQRSVRRFEPLLQVSARCSSAYNGSSLCSAHGWWKLRLLRKQAQQRCEKLSSSEWLGCKFKLYWKIYFCLGFLWVCICGTFGALHPAPFFSPFRDCTFNSTECFETCTLASATAPSHPPGPVEPPKNPSHAVFSTITYLCATALRATLTGLFHQCHWATLSFYWQNASTQLSGASIQQHMEAFIPLAPNKLC